MSVLLYDMAVKPATFDIVPCLATGIARGARSVRFVLGKWMPKDYSQAQAEQRFKSIILPMPALFGLPCSIGEPEGTKYSHLTSSALMTYCDTKALGKITMPCVDKGYVTITLRRSRTSMRDSHDNEWRAFAKRLDRKVVFIPDYEQTPIGLHERMQLYAGAHMNFFVNNGPLTLCIYSDAPYLSMRTIQGEGSGAASPKFMAAVGIKPGFQYPWARPNQRLSYLDDTADNIAAEYAKMSDHRMAA